MRPDLVKNPIPNKENFYAKSIAGKVEIRFHTNNFLFGRTDVPIKFVLLPDLKTFHGIIGNDTLKELNMTSIRTDHMTQKQKNRLQQAASTTPNLFSARDENLTYTTKVIGKIKTEDPVYSKTYPYPMSLKNEIESQVKTLLKGSIIRPSKSSNNSPVWIVPKKVGASGEKSLEW